MTPSAPETLTPFESRVLHAIERERLVSLGDTIICAVSGGADSMALLRLLHRLRACLGIDVEVAHLHHQIPEALSDEAEALVVRTAQALSLPCHRLRVDVPGLSRRTGLTLEAAGREARLRMFGRLVAARPCARVATAHTADDQAETVLHRLLRGTFLGGVAGIRPGLALHRRGVADDRGSMADPGQWNLIRPLLGIRRRDVRAYALAQGGEIVEDPTNGDPTFTRNRIRLELLPLLEEGFNPRVVEALCRFARRAREDDLVLDAHAVATASELVEPHAGGRWHVRASLGEAAAPVRWRVLARLLQAVGQEVDEHRLARVEDLLRGRPGRKASLGKATAVRTYDGVEIGTDGEGPPEAVLVEPVPVPLDEFVDLPGVGRLCVSRGPMPGPGLPLPGSAETSPVIGTRETAAPWDALLDAERVHAAGLLEVRTRRPGDRWIAPGGTRERKLKATFNRRRVSPSLRDRLPLLTAGGQVICIPGLGADERYRARADSREILRVRFLFHESH